MRASGPRAFLTSPPLARIPDRAASRPLAAPSLPLATPVYMHRVANPRAPADTLCGDPNYIAPEQTLSPFVDGRADLYSVGISLYELTTGALPFEALSDAPVTDLLAAHRQIEPIPPSLRLPWGTDSSVSARVDRVFARACAKRPEDRYQSARDLQAALVAPLDGV